MFQAVVVDIRLQSRDGLAAVWEMALDRTEFAPGQQGRLEAVSRAGTRLSIPVRDVFSDEAGVLWHLVEKPLAAGTDVQGFASDEA